jgi:hypothetical protein
MTTQEKRMPTTTIIKEGHKNATEGTIKAENSTWGFWNMGQRSFEPT